ncbi:MAG TPA: NrfD/PsrC family molybdoenzyme membrane anchor subunit [Amycolatopsis sp.]|uniref:NrfD/PsrC family molybdoenzyme membrane anchor subunit n=1 Tax=Amycolatopsis sp. TaxID=37632 RepID=UPI002B46D9C4|nr:NrfD/PsrC family molybdoenzyme membrane anchor subunit [Amycolatopsis sp.]HKS48340.1 NrfD/PsrC family molybdoenzyme membrane anchor subunit [Amycolatopsis sp.]
MTSYYGRPVLKPPVWEWKIPGYLFTGGLSAGSALLGAGGDLTGRPALRRAGRLGALASLGVSTYLLVADLGRPGRFHHMLRVARPTSPMSVGSWLLMAYAPGTGVAALSELVPRRLPPRWRPVVRAAGLESATVAPAVACYTAVLLSQTAVPAWHEAHRELPFVFAGSAAASSGGLGMLFAPVEEAGTARVFAAYGGVTELVLSRVLENRPGLLREVYRTGRAHRLRKWSEALTAAGLVSGIAARRSRAAAVVSGLALLAGSALQRFGVFEAGVASTRDPKYVVEPQRERLRAASSGSRPVPGP